MMSSICIFLLLVFPSICGQESNFRLRPATFTQYFYWKTWTEARSFCRKKHTDLVTIQSEKDNQVILFGRGWIGMYREDDNSPWKWSRGDEEATFFRWNLYVFSEHNYQTGEQEVFFSSPPGPHACSGWETAPMSTFEPHANRQEHCAMKYPGSVKWKNDGCDVEAAFMCYDEKLVLVKDNKTWQEALEHCRSLGGGDSGNQDTVYRNQIYDLASLITEDDHEYARERAQRATTEEVWTGLRFLGDQWFWVSGEPVQYQDIPSCPAVRCGVLEKSSMTPFGIRDCSQRRNFFCYKKSQND